MQNKTFLLITFLCATFLACGFKLPCTNWNKPLEREDVVVCNATRAGDTANQGELKFKDCLNSLGYYVVETECSK